MRVLVCGGRKFGYPKLGAQFTARELQLDDIQATAEREHLSDLLTHLHRTYGFTLLIHGAAAGADRLAGAWATAQGVPTQSFPADWSIGKRAGLERNERMLRDGQPDLVVAFKGGRGTAHMKHIAQAAGVRVIDAAREGAL